MIDAGQRPYQPFGAAKQLWTDRRDELLLSGPAGTGKSRAILEKLHAICLRWPGARCLMVRKTRASLTEAALVTYEEKVLPEGSPIAAGAKRRMRQSYHYPNGSEVVVGGLDVPTKVMSTEYDFIYVQEAIELFESDWESLTTRLRNGVVPFQQLVGDTNPDGPQHWLYLRCNRGQTALLPCHHEDNPTLWDRATNDWTPTGRVYIGKLDNLTGVRKPRLRFGKWVQAEGTVYEFDRDLHTVAPFEIPASWRRFRSIDFGYTNPFVCQWWAIDGDGRLFLYREIYCSQRTVKVHAGQINALTKGERIEGTVADHDREDRATLEENGITTMPAWKAITPGIQAVEERLKKAGDGKPRLFIVRGCLAERDDSLAERKLPCSTIEEFDHYVWPKGSDGKPVKEVPVDRDNHGMDAMRYAVAYADGLGTVWVEVL